MEEKPPVWEDRIFWVEMLEKIAYPVLNNLSKDIREFLIHNVSKTGGHLASNLGVVELTIALHYVFNSPVDKIVFDVSHQCYAHKIITGRKHGFLNPEYYNKISGYTAPSESEHDCFVSGHASNSISAA